MSVPTRNKAQCFKSGCLNPGVTWEILIPMERRPSLLCRAHALKPYATGSVANPTIVRARLP